MKRSSGIIVGGLSATLLTTGAAFGSGFLTPEPVASAEASIDQAAPQETQASSDQSTDQETDQSTDQSTDDSTAQSTDGTAATDSTDTAASSATYTGSAITSRYGVFQAEITVTDGAITDITWVQEGEADRHSQQINARAVPELEAAILDAQSVDVGYISGASFTSEAVEDAVYSAMQQAGLA